MLSVPIESDRAWRCGVCSRDTHNLRRVCTWCLDKPLGRLLLALRGPDPVERLRAWWNESRASAEPPAAVE